MAERKGQTQLLTDSAPLADGAIALFTKATATLAEGLTTPPVAEGVTAVLAEGGNALAALDGTALLVEGGIAIMAEGGTGLLIKGGTALLSESGTGHFLKI